MLTGDSHSYRSLSCLFLISYSHSDILCLKGKRITAGGMPMRGRGSAGRLAMRRGGRHRGGPVGRGGAMPRGAVRGGIARGERV